MDFLTLEQSVWSRLKEETRPIVLYGMGDGCLLYTSDAADD